MFFRFEFIGDETLVYIPDSTPWRIIQKSYEEDFGIYLLYDNNEIHIRDLDRYCSGRDIPEFEVQDLYTDLVDKIMELVIADNPPSCICFEDVENQLLTEKYYKRWCDKGYITPDSNGTW